MRSIRDRRPYPEIPGPAVTLSLFLGAVLRRSSLLQIQTDTRRRGWQHLIHWAQRISDDCLGYVLERYRLEDWRQMLVHTNRRLKENKQFESAKIGGLLVVALDANEQFSSRSRCCGTPRAPHRTGPWRRQRLGLEEARTPRT